MLLARKYDPDAAYPKSQVLDFDHIFESIKISKLLGQFDWWNVLKTAFRSLLDAGFT